MKYKIDFRHGEIDWSNVPRTLDGNFACSMCCGSGMMKFPARKKSTEETRFCISCNGTGYLIEEILLSLNFEQRQAEKCHCDNQKLSDWIKNSSTCKICCGDQMKIAGGVPCKECGLEGKLPWGG